LEGSERGNTVANFEESRWADSNFSQNYRDNSNQYLPFRDQFVEVTKLGYEYFISKKNEANILDLGCGDGLFIYELAKASPFLNATLVDASSEMLSAAKTRLSNQENIDFIQASFQEIVDSDPLNEQFDFIYSSLAIHHLSFREKKRLYSYIFDHLSPGGYFFNYDVVLSQTTILEEWHLSLWREWINIHSTIESPNKLLNIPSKYKSNPDNVPDTLESQIEVLRNLGFENVDCIFKFGIFSLFVGSRIEEDNNSIHSDTDSAALHPCR
jgi:tRNA (cmo5U34)-methyltransferase